VKQIDEMIDGAVKQSDEMIDGAVIEMLSCDDEGSW